MPKKVFVSGCFDMLHSGHVAFFEEAASYGELYVGIGSDKTIADLKARKTINSDAERLYMVKSLKTVKDAWINSGNGLLDFLDQLTALKPDIFFVNTDGHTQNKEELCEKLGIEYIVSNRIPHQNLPKRSTTELRTVCNIPYRIDLAGGWLDQPYVSRFYPGPVITISIEPDYEFNNRSGMSTSSRMKAIELWQTDIPEGDKVKLAKTLFCYENPPGTKYVSGSQDSLGIVLPGLNKLFYEKEEYWPSKIETIIDEEILVWLEKHLWLVSLSPRESGYDVLQNTNINEEFAKKLSSSAQKCWDSIKNKNAIETGNAIKEAFEAQIAMFPNMITPPIFNQIEEYKNMVYGWKLSGAGGGGYIILFSENKIEKSLQIRIRR